jgi:hypothetical protein
MVENCCSHFRPIKLKNIFHQNFVGINRVLFNLVFCFFKMKDAENLINKAREEGSLLHREEVSSAFFDTVEESDRRKEAVPGAHVVLTRNTGIIHVRKTNPVEYKAFVPPRSGLIPESNTKYLPAGDYPVSCAQIIGKRKASADIKTSLNEALRHFQVAV